MNLAGYWHTAMVRKVVDAADRRYLSQLVQTPISLKKLLATVIVLPLLAYAVLCLIFVTNQRHMLYFPTPDIAHTVATDLRLDLGGESLKIWHHPRATGKAMLYFGGNAESVASSVAHLRTAFPGHALFVMNYRGYGGSSGEPSEPALVDDARALFDYVQQRYSDVGVVGRSLGSGVAMQLAADRPVSKLALVTPFDSIATIIEDRFWFLPVSILLRDKFDSAKHAKDIESPVLLILAENDEIVTRDSSMALLRAFGEHNAAAVVLANEGHNSIAGSAGYLSALRDFFAE